MKVLIALALLVCSVYGASLNKRDLRDDLLTRASNLETTAEEAIKSLTAGGHTAQATALTREVARLKTLATELKAAVGDVAIRRYETEIRAIETRVAEEIRRAEGRTGSPAGTTAAPTTAAPPAPTTAASLVKRDLKDDLLTRAASLETQTKDAIAKLTADGRANLATGLQREETRLETLATELKAATNEAEVRRLETQLRVLETALTVELRLIEGRTRQPVEVATTAASLVKRDLRDDLLARAATLETQAEAAAKTLTAAGHTAQATAITREAARLKTVATELKDATGDAAIRRYETEIRAIEGRIAEEIRRAEGRTGGPPATTGGPPATTAAPPAPTTAASS
jgi:hypothetical protein